LWPRRQEAEKETFTDQHGRSQTALVTLEEYQMLKTDSSGSKGMHIISVSHCWEAEQHPDPFGSQSRRLAEQLQRESKWLGLDMWCFVDFMSLPQHGRTTEEEAFFRKAVASMHVLYAHRSVEKVIIL
ncbi:NLRC3, partial [Symbiodinium pilosum]